MAHTLQDMYFDTILPNLKSGSAEQVFQKLVNHVSNLIGTSEKDLYNLLIENGALKNSGIGNGVSIIHAKLPRLTRPMIIFAQLTSPMPFNSVDAEPVDMVAMVLSPEYQGPVHLQRLSMVTRFFSDEETRAALRAAPDYDSIRMVVKDMSERKKAA